MSLETAPFPQRDLTVAELTDFNLMLGSPKVERPVVMNILVQGKQSLNANTRMFRLLGAAMTQTIADLGSNYKPGSRLFTGGALFFASVYQFANMGEDLVLHEAAISELEQRENRDLILDGPRDLKSQVGNFYSLLEHIMPVLNPGTEPPELAFIGASAVHAAVLKSQQIPSVTPTSGIIPEQLISLETDPSFRDLQEIYKEELG